MERYLERKLREEYADLQTFVDTNEDGQAEWHQDYHEAASPLISECGVCSNFVKKYARYLQLKKLIEELDAISTMTIDELLVSARARALK